MRGVPAEARCWVSPAGLLSWCVSFRFPVSLTGWMAGFRALPFPFDLSSRFARLRKTRARAHICSCTNLHLRSCCSCCPCCWLCWHWSGRPFSWCHLVPAPVLCWPGVFTCLRVGAVAPMLRLKPLTVALTFVWPTLGRIGSSVNGWVLLHLCFSHAVDCGIVHCPADARPDWWLQQAECTSLQGHLHTMADAALYCLVWEQDRIDEALSTVSRESKFLWGPSS